MTLHILYGGDEYQADDPALDVTEQLEDDLGRVLDRLESRAQDDLAWEIADRWWAGEAWPS